MRTCFTKQTKKNGLVIAEEQPSGKIVVTGTDGSAIKHYITCADIVALDLLIEVLVGFRAKYAADHATETQETPRRIDIEM